MALDINGLEEEHIQKLFIEFPMPLVLLSRDGEMKFSNKQFQERFDITTLNCGEFQALLADQNGEPHNISLPDRHANPVPLLLYTIALAHFTLCVFDNTPGTASDGELEEMHRRLAELERLSATDSLTGAWNRLPLERTADIEIKRSMRYHHPISLIFLDVDRFKQINDQYGHNIGDEVLKVLVTVVQGRIRESDTLYRWGGEEFVVLATSTNHRSAAILAEKLRQLIEQHTFPHVGKITISLGVAEFLPGDQLEDWIHRSDKALYTAKAEGRNQVIVDPNGASDIWTQEQETRPLQLVWHDHYTCGNSLIDEQHYTLFKQSNQLLNLALDESDDVALYQQLETVIDTIKQHFHDEEQILQAQHYSEFVTHHQLHQQLLEEAESLRQAVQQGKQATSQLLNYIAHEVIFKHILVADRAYFDTLQTAPPEPQ